MSDAQESLLLARGTVSSYCSGMGTVEHIVSWITAVLPFTGLGEMKYLSKSVCASASESWDLLALAGNGVQHVRHGTSYVALRLNQAGPKFPSQEGAPV